MTRSATILFALAVACGSEHPTAPGSSNISLIVESDPASAQIITSDLVHFWEAYDSGGRSGSASQFQTRYLDVASPGLADFVRARSVTAASLADMMTVLPAYFASIRSSNLALATDGRIVARIRANYVTIKSLYPRAVFAPLTFLIGRFSTGGTTSQNGMLIGTEFYSMTPSTPLTELPSFQRVNVKPVDSLPIIVAHEHAHTLQARFGGLMARPIRTLLEQSLIEGGADFIGERSSGGNINGRLWTYAIPREAALWQEFKNQMHGTDVSQWLYNQGSASDTPDHPGDLGYFIGYRIAEAYYRQTTDTISALRDIIELSDADGFLARSGYSPSPPSARRVASVSASSGRLSVRHRSMRGNRTATPDL